MILKTLEKLRYFLFWLKNRVARSGLSAQCNDVKFIQDNPNSTSAIHARDEHLKKILRHAIETVPHYKNYSLDTPLSNFEVVNKKLITSHKKAFESVTYSNKSKIPVSTSGSTGTPFEVYQNLNKKTRNTADVMYFSKLVNFNVGERLYYWRHWNEHYQKNKNLLFIQNIVPINVFDLNDERFEIILRQLKNDKSSKHFIGYASAFEKLCKFLDKNNGHLVEGIKIKSVIAISEPLTNYTKERMGKYFKAPIVSRYSNTENGILAQQDYPNSDKFIINQASYNLEILDMEKNIPVPNGTLGRIVVTDFFNYCMPLIRFDTGDLGVMQTINGIDVLSKIVGRKSDVIFNTKNEEVTSLIALDFSMYKGLLEGQIIQNGAKEYVLKLHVDHAFDKEKELLEKFRLYFGEDALITIDYVESIPLLKSGKRKLAINNYIKN